LITSLPYRNQSKSVPRREQNSKSACPSRFYLERPADGTSSLGQLPMCGYSSRAPTLDPLEGCPFGEREFRSHSLDGKSTVTTEVRSQHQNVLVGGLSEELSAVELAWTTSSQKQELKFGATICAGVCNVSPMRSTSSPVNSLAESTIREYAPAQFRARGSHRFGARASTVALGPRRGPGRRCPRRRSAHRGP